MLPGAYFGAGLVVIAAVQAARRVLLSRPTAATRLLDHVATWGKTHVPLSGCSVPKR